jgi:uncharacterized protein (AIM24 family)
MRSALFGEEHMESAAQGMTLQNPKLLRVRFAGEFHARQGSMVAYQGNVDFAYQSQGIGRFMKQALTGESLPLMKVTGQGDVFLADDADEIHLVELEGDSITVNGKNILALEAGMQWDVRRVEGAGMFAGGLFNTVVTGHGQMAITAHGTPVVLQVDTPTFVDVQSAVAWSTTLQTSVRRTAKMGAVIGRGSGEAVQLAFSGSGFVVVQASEGKQVLPHSH